MVSDQPRASVAGPLQPIRKGPFLLLQPGRENCPEILALSSALAVSARGHCALCLLEEAVSLYSLEGGGQGGCSMGVNSLAGNTLSLLGRSACLVFG